MKYILTIMLFISATANAQQYKLVNFNKVIIRYDSTTVNETPESIAGKSWVLLRLKSNNDTLAVFFDNGDVWTKAAVVSGNIALIGTSTLVQVTIPSTVGTDRYYLNNQVLYRYSVNTHEFDLFSNKTLRDFVRKSDGKVTAQFHGNGCKWHVAPTTFSLIAQGIVTVVIP